MTDHLTETEVSLFRERTIMPTARERVDAHVAECESCLRRILPSEDSALVYSELTEALLPRDADEAFHLSHADLRRYANGVVDQADTVIFESHLEICDQCSEAMHSLPASPLVETVSASTRQAEIPAEQFSPAWRSAFQFTPARAVAGVMVALSLVLAFVVWLRWPGGPVDQTTQKTTSQTPSNTLGGSSPEPTQT
jgi:predicted anti-sigma-YlaC factor YlaD